MWGCSSTNGSKCDVIEVRSSEGAVCMELMPLSAELARAFVRSSPRNLKLDNECAGQLESRLSETGYSRILLQDTRGRLLSRALQSRGWSVTRAIDSNLKQRYSVVSTSDLPLDEDLIDQDGKPVELADTGHMLGLCMEVEDRQAWAFYTDEGETARVMTAGARRTGLIVATRQEDFDLVTDQLVRFLVTAKKSWAIFSRDMESRISRYHPTQACRMELEAPGKHDHSVPPLSKANRKAAVALFSEYYDENRFSAGARLRRLHRDRAYAIFVADGGFVIVRFEKDIGLLYDIYVTPVRQGEGIGDELMRCAIDAISDRAPAAYLHTSYPRAKRLYEKYGFREESSHLVLRLDEVALTPPPSR